MRDIISRFAPAPTGFLHLGHVVNAEYVWREARARHGRVWLRIEDHDRQRSQPRFEASILEDLEWLGFAADGSPVRQSERGDIYEEALDRLRRRGLVYACGCSRIDVARALEDRHRDAEADVARAFPASARETDVRAAARLAEAPEARRRQARDRGGPEKAALQPNADVHSGAELRYPGTCAHRGLAEGPGLGLRVRLEPTVERFVDLRHGPQEQRPSEQCGDLLVRDRDGNWTYQFAATVDDLVQGVTLIVRGDDLLASTGRQIQLARLLGRSESAEFLHHPLIMKSRDQKLSKSDGDTGIRELRARGWTPRQVIDAAMAALRP
jgi:glutamyl-tRNA synthetase/glutamyl-Q tRNA(Asp) synthetase